MALSAEELAMRTIVQTDKKIADLNKSRNGFGMISSSNAFDGLAIQRNIAANQNKKAKKTLNKFKEGRERQRQEDLTSFEARQNSLKEATLNRAAMLAQGRQGTLLGSRSPMMNSTLTTGAMLGGTSMSPVKTLLGQ